ncbi:MAG: hypothetical protein ACT4QG_05840 [Sporichthyaceae bacterium]
MNLTFEHHEESRFNERVFQALLAGLRADPLPGLRLVDLFRVPGPPNSEFAVGLELARDGREWVEEIAVADWPALPDPSAEHQAAALVATVRARLAEATPPEDAERSRSWWRRRR